MNWIDRLERKYGRFAVPNITGMLVAGQVVVYILSLLNPQLEERLLLVPSLVLQGEVWRLASFLFLPPATNPLFAFFFWYLFYFMGNSLEHSWGMFRFNLYLLIGFTATAAVAWLTPNQPTSNLFAEFSVFLAFAYLFPNFQLMLFFFLPVKIQWLAMLSWIGLAITVAVGDWPMRFAALASVANFLLFFGPEIQSRVLHGHRTMSRRNRELIDSGKPFHKCVVCGATEKTAPDRTFRYCSKCHGSQCYCDAHLHNHSHVPAPEQSQA